MDELAYTDLDELTVFIAKSGRGCFAEPKATAKAVQTARGSYRLPKSANDSVNQAMPVSIATMQALESQIKLDKAIE